MSRPSPTSPDQWRREPKACVCQPLQTATSSSTQCVAHVHMQPPISLAPPPLLSRPRPYRPRCKPLWLACFTSSIAFSAPAQGSNYPRLGLHLTGVVAPLFQGLLLGTGKPGDDDVLAARVQASGIWLRPTLRQRTYEHNVSARKHTFFLSVCALPPPFLFWMFAGKFASSRCNYWTPLQEDLMASFILSVCTKPSRYCVLQAAANNIACTVCLYTCTCTPPLHVPPAYTHTPPLRISLPFCTNSIKEEGLPRPAYPYIA
ncbi:hypothetical protein J3F83DRAFT_251661 [Trichoderma novae-zelandiae]